MSCAPRRVFVVGVGMTKFEKPGRRDWDYPDMGRIAATRALEDAQVPYDAVDQVVCGYCYGDSTCGQRTVYQLGMTGVPVYNVNNNCATGSTALYMARQFVEGGMSECVLAVGFEKMEKGSLGSKYTDRVNPVDKHFELMVEERGFEPGPGTPQMFGNAGREHMEKYGTKAEHFAKIAEKNHRHSSNNPYSQFRTVYSLDEILASKSIFDPLTKLQCCPTSDGSAAVVVASEEFVVRHGLQGQAVEIVGQAMATDLPTTFSERSCMKMVGYDMTRRAAQIAFSQAGARPEDVDVVELHDCFSANELITYEALGLCGEGKAGEFVDAGENTYGGRVVVNPSGGLISKGHPLGATGLAQCAEMCWQLRQEAGPRQVPDARLALSHNLGLGGAVVVTLYRRPAEWEGAPKRCVRSGAMGFEEGEAAVATAPAAAGGTAELKSAALFDKMAEGIAAQGAKLVKQVNAVIQFNIKPDGVWTVDLKNGSGSVTRGAAAGKPDLAITVSDDDFVAMSTGALNPQTAFMRGKLKIKGNMGIAMKLGNVMKMAQGQQAAAGGAAELKSAALFDQMAEGIAAEGAKLVKQVNAVIQFNIKPDGVWTVDLKSGSGSVTRGTAAGKPDLAITVSDDDFVAMSTGALNPQTAFMRGKLKIKGNMGIAMKLGSVMKAARPAARL